MVGRLYIVAVVVAMAAAVQACTDAMDCSLNGDCVDGVCHCDAGWVASDDGPPCSKMVFEPSDPALPGYRNESADTWGAKPVYWEADKKWHIFTAMFSNGCNVDSWKNNSFIFHAVGDTAQGPWVGSDVSVTVFSHNPQAVLHADGTWLLYFIGGWHIPQTDWLNCTQSPSEWPPAPAGPGMGPTVDGCGPNTNRGCGVRYAHSRSPYGPWVVEDVVVQNANKSSLFDCAKTNPAPWVLRNGSVLMAVNGGFCHNHIENIGVMMAETWSAPFNLVSLGPISSADGCQWPGTLAEDPTLWESARGYHIMGHSQCSHGVYSLYAFSRDAITWTVSRSRATGLPVNAYDINVAWTNGSVTDFGRMERPIVVPPNPSIGTPLVLSNAVKWQNRSWAVLRTIKQ